MAEFERIVSLVNEYSSQITHARPVLNDIYAHYPKLPHLDITTLPEKQHTEARLDKVLHPGDLVVVAGGDDTMNTAANVLAGRKEIAMLPLKAGNGNDFVHGLYGKAARLAPHELLTRGQPVAIHPLRVALDGLDHKLAVNYVSAGATAYGSRVLNHPWYRSLPGYQLEKLRDAYEWSVLPLSAFILSRSFRITEEGHERRVIDFTAANGPFMAKHAKLPIELQEPRAFAFECNSELQLLNWALNLVNGTPEGRYLERDRERRLQIGRTVLAHIDAEPFTIEKGTELTLSIHPKPFYALTPRPLL